VWQVLREELHPKGLEVVTVALDARGAAVARPSIEKAGARHPSLIDETHQLDRLGVVNVPTGLWIDEAGIIVRPPEPAHPRRPAYKDQVVPADASPTERERIETVKALHVDPDRYVGALRDWVERGAVSPYALAPGEVVRRSRPRGIQEATADAHFAMAHALHTRGDAIGAITHFKEAHRLHPTNWTYRRDAWAIAGPEHASIYGTTWLDDVRREGVERYYPPLDL
jgi:hypothetical protein